MEPNETKRSLQVEHIGNTLVQLPSGYQITAIPGWAYNAGLRMYYFIPEQKFVPSDSVWIDEFREVRAGSAGPVHPNLIATAIASTFCLLILSIEVADIFYGFLSAGAGVAVLLGLFLCIVALMLLLITRPTELMREAYSRKK